MEQRGKIGKAQQQVIKYSQHTGDWQEEKREKEKQPHCEE